VASVLPGDPDDDSSAAPSGSIPTPAATVLPGAPAEGRLPGEPDPVLTPGALNPDVTDATIGSTICVSGWTSMVRPPASYTNGLKVEGIAAYGYSNADLSAYEEDHLIPLQLGGAPSDPTNLWPQPYDNHLPDGRDVGARVKDSFETSLKKEVCAGQLSLEQARAEIGIHWAHYFYGIPLGASVTASGAPSAAATPLPSASGAIFVTFVSLTGPAVRGEKATITVQTVPDAVCAAKVKLPSGNRSEAAGLQATPTAGDDGVASWTWNVASSTEPGTAHAMATCTLGTSASANATFEVR
jgi:hypothetical protein